MSNLIHEDKVIQSISNTWQTQARGSNSQEYEIYLSGGDKKTGLWLDDTPIKTYDEWLNS